MNGFDKLAIDEAFKDPQQALITVGLLSAAIVHDLRNPLTTICAGAELLMDPNCSSTQARRLIANIYDAAGRMRKLLVDLTNITRERKIRAELCGIRDVIGSASERVLMTMQQQRLEILLDVPDGINVPLVRSHMERVFFNLIANASEAMPEGGVVRIGARKSCGSVLIELEDTGPGIPFCISDRLFEPLVTSGKQEGLGLGLALARHTVRNHGGDMWTEPAAGARFIIRLPLQQNRFAVRPDGF